MFRIILYILVFLLSVAILAKVRSARSRQAVLLVGSYVLYSTWGIWFACILLASTVVNYVVGESLRRRPTRLTLAAGILINLTILGSFKYLPEIAIRAPVASLQRFAYLALPLGISFWTFQAMSYLFDLYRGEELDPSFLEFALYMAFFPVAISGPICRVPDMLPQFRAQRATPWSDIGQGIVRIATGALMMQLAKLMGQGVLSGDGINRGFDQLTGWSGADVWCLAFGYGLQLFFDFAGYSHIAIGAAKALGFQVPENFDHPFEATNPSVFWTRWHMSLSFWIRDYLFFPLAVARREMWWRNFVLVLSMVIFGLWHGATVLFLFWGFYHGMLLVLHRLLQQSQRRLNWEPRTVFWTAASWLMTISSISLGWILFRANSSAQARQMLGAVLSPASYGTHFLSGSLYFLVAFLAAGYAAVLVVQKGLERAVVEPQAVESRSAILVLLARHRWYWIPPLYGLALVVVLIVTHTQGAVASQFMYRRF